eukprot:337980-Rhodomonas_salina.1
MKATTLGERGHPAGGRSTWTLHTSSSLKPPAVANRRNASFKGAAGSRPTSSPPETVPSSHCFSGSSLAGGEEYRLTTRKRRGEGGGGGESWRTRTEASEREGKEEERGREGSLRAIDPTLGPARRRRRRGEEGGREAAAATRERASERGREGLRMSLGRRGERV